MTRRRPRRLSLSGELTIVTAAERHQKLVPFLGSGPDLDLDLSGVTDLDTAGLQLLLLAKREAAAQGANLRFRNPSEQVTEVLAIAHLDADLQSVAGPDGSETEA